MAKSNYRNFWLGSPIKAINDADITKGMDHEALEGPMTNTA